MLFNPTTLSPAILKSAKSFSIHNILSFFIVLIYLKLIYFKTYLLTALSQEIVISVFITNYVVHLETSIEPGKGGT